MPTNFPTSVDNFTNPTANDSLNLPSHSTQHANANDAIEAVEDYLLNGAGKAGLVLLKTQAVGSGVSSVVVTDAFNTNYQNYKIIYSGGTGSGIQDIVMILGSNTSNYYWGEVAVTYGAGAVTGGGSGGATSSWRVGKGAIDGNVINMDIFNPFASVRTGFNHSASFFGTSAATVTGGGWLNNTVSYTGFTISVGGNITGGNIYVYGYKVA
jgi:hypothetical protein